MDFDIGNIFYIIITLIVVIIGLMGKKKPGSKGAGKGKGSPVTGFMENLEKAFNPDQEEQYAMDPREEQYTVDIQEAETDLPQEETEPGYDDAPKPLTLMEEYELTLKNTGEQGDLGGSLIEEMVTDPLEIIELDEVEGIDYCEAIRRFEAGTAVVYSTIINRLDY